MRPPDNRRIRVVEAVKGFAIVLVVYGHVAQGVAHRGWWNSQTYLFEERFIYSFHMASFFFVSGLFVSGSIERYGRGQFVIQRLRTVLWPYLFCALGDVVNVAFAQSSALHAKGWLHGLVIPVLTGEASWFLPTLFLCLMLAVITQRVPNWLRCVLAVALCVLWPGTRLRILDSVARYFAFLAAGEWVNRRIEGFESTRRLPALVGSIALFALVALGCMNWSIDARVLVIPLGLAGTGALFLLATGLRGTWFDSAAVWCGAASLGVFVLHPFFQGATRVVLARMATSHAALPNVAIPTIVAIIGPGLLWHYRKPLRIEFLFAFPWGEPKRKTAARAEAAVAGLVAGE